MFPSSIAQPLTLAISAPDFWQSLQIQPNFQHWLERENPQTSEDLPGCTGHLTPHEVRRLQEPAGAS